MEKKKPGPGPKQTNGSPCKRSGRQRRGRKPASESRATEIRAKLMEWKQTPEQTRISLRALAAEMGTSHQLLGFYLRRLPGWQIKEYKCKEEQIRARAEREGRFMAYAEQQQALGYARAATEVMAEYVISGILDSCLTDVKRGTKLPLILLSQLRVLADRGDRKAQKVVMMHDNLPRSAPPVAKSFRSGCGVPGNSAKTDSRAIT